MGLLGQADARRDGITAMSADPRYSYPGREVSPRGLGRRGIEDVGHNRVAFVSCLRGFGYKS